jgi:hypothetical protein
MIDEPNHGDYEADGPDAHHQQVPALPEVDIVGPRALASRAYRGVVRSSHAGRGRPQVHMVTEARRSLSDDISFRQRRYLLMMGIRAVCFVIAVVMFVNHLGWLTVIPAAGAIFFPYFAVVFANGGREPSNTRGFMEYRPNLPATRDPAGPQYPSSENGHRPAGPTAGDN